VNGNIVYCYFREITSNSIFISSENKKRIAVPVANKVNNKIRKENNLAFLLLIPAVAIIYFVGRSSARSFKKTD